MSLPFLDAMIDPSGANGSSSPPEPGSPEAEREKRALEAWKQQLEGRVRLIEERLRLIERRGSDHDHRLD